MRERINFILIYFFIVPLIMSAQSTQLTIRAFSEGYYRASTGKMAAVIDTINFPLLCDTALLKLVDTLTKQTIYCTDVVISTDGYGTQAIPTAMNGKYCFASLKFRNTFHLVSRFPVKLNGLPAYVDLTKSTNACCNFDTTNGVVKTYSGDINNDGITDVFDFLIMDVEVQNHATGYLISDLTGDHVVDYLDENILLKNISAARGDDFTGGCLVNEISENERVGVHIYPNPFSDYFNINLDKAYKKIQFTLKDMMGRVYQRVEYDGEMDIHIQSNQLPSGIYFIDILSEGMQARQMKLLKIEN